MSHPHLTIESTIARSDVVVCSTLHEEALIMNIDRGRYHSLNAVGAQIWEMIADRVVVAAICDRLAPKFDCSREQCEQDVLAFLGDLLERDIIRVDKTEGS